MYVPPPVRKVNKQWVSVVIDQREENNASKAKHGYGDVNAGKLFSGAWLDLVITADVNASCSCF